MVFVLVKFEIKKNKIKIPTFIIWVLKTTKFIEKKH